MKVEVSPTSMRTRSMNGGVQKRTIRGEEAARRRSSTASPRSSIASPRSPEQKVKFFKLIYGGAYINAEIDKIVYTFNNKELTIEVHYKNTFEPMACVYRCKDAFNNFMREALHNNPSEEEFQQLYELYWRALSLRQAEQMNNEDGQPMVVEEGLALTSERWTVHSIERMYIDSQGMQYFDVKWHPDEEIVPIQTREEAEDVFKKLRKELRGTGFFKGLRVFEREFFDQWGYKQNNQSMESLESPQEDEEEEMTEQETQSNHSMEELESPQEEEEETTEAAQETQNTSAVEMNEEEDEETQCRRTGVIEGEHIAPDSDEEEF